MAMDPLSLIAAQHGTDKWGIHFYTPTYHEVLGHLRDRPVRLLEIGVGGYANPDCGGLSLLMWRDYFPNGRIFGLDNEFKRLPSQDRIEIVRGDQSSASDLEVLAHTHGPFDVIIDDGSHRPKHVVFSFENLFPALREDGIYIVEDTQTSYLKEFGGAHPATAGKSSVSYFAELAESLNYREIRRIDPAWQQHPFASRIREIRFLHNLIIIRAGSNLDPSNLGSMVGEASLQDALAALDAHLTASQSAPFARLTHFLIDAQYAGCRDAANRFPDDLLDAVVNYDAAGLRSHAEVVANVERRLREGGRIEEADRLLDLLLSLFPDNRNFLLTRIRTAQGTDLGAAYIALAEQVKAGKVGLELAQFQMLGERLVANGLNTYAVEACTLGLQRFPADPALEKARADVEGNLNQSNYMNKMRTMLELIMPSKSSLNARVRQITGALNLAGAGLEYGPLDKPLLKRPDFNIRYLDYAPRTELCERYKSDPNVDVSRIPEIDFVSEGKLVSQVVQNERFEYIVASHVAEHVPDLIGWIESNLAVLSPGGRLAVAFPDRRYCFDIHRSLTSDAVAAYLERRTKPTFQQICDHFFNAAIVTPVDAWNGTVTASNAKTIRDKAAALAMVKGFLAKNIYVDSHCWKFSDVELLEFLKEIRNLFKLNYEIVSFFPTQRNTLEFYFTIEKC